jgi:benzodiazapine receptor
VALAGALPHLLQHTQMHFPKDCGAALQRPLLYGISAQQLLNLVGYFIFLLFSSIGGGGGFGKSIGAVSTSLPTAITPAGWAFSIWSAIFTLTGTLCVAQAFPSRREWAWRKLGVWWILNTWVGEGLWTFAWVFQWGGMWVSALLLAFVVGTLAALYLSADMGVAPLSGDAEGISPPPALLCCPFLLPSWLSAALRRKGAAPRSALDAYLLEPSVSLYMSWTTAATILNFTIALVASGVSASGPLAAPLGVLLLLTAAGLAVCAAVLRTDAVYAAGLCWALAGIYSQQLNPNWPIKSGDVAKAAALASGAAGAAAVGALCWRLWMWRSGALVVTWGKGSGTDDANLAQEPALLAEVA